MPAIGTSTATDSLLEVSAEVWKAGVRADCEPLDMARSNRVYRGAFQRLRHHRRRRPICTDNGTGLGGVLRCSSASILV